MLSLVRSNGTVKARDSVLSDVFFEITENKGKGRINEK
jgi:hypothetical protein